MAFTTSITIHATTERVWSVMTDLERWPEWTASVSSIERLDDTPLQVGSRIRIQQPKLPSAVWTVTDLQPGRSFTWSAVSGGITSVADHRIEPGPEGSVTVTLSIRHRGLLAPLLELLGARLIRRYVTMEAQGLKQRSEARPLASVA